MNSSFLNIRFKVYFLTPITKTNRIYRYVFIHYFGVELGLKFCKIWAMTISLLEWLPIEVGPLLCPVATGGKQTWPQKIPHCSSPSPHTIPSPRHLSPPLHNIPTHTPGCWLACSPSALPGPPSALHLSHEVTAAAMASPLRLLRIPAGASPPSQSVLQTPVQSGVRTHFPTGQEEKQKDINK